MRRRTLLAGMAMIPAVPRAQTGARVQRVGVLSPFTPPNAAPWHSAFENGLRALGWIPGTNVALEYKYSNGDSARLPELAAELLQSDVALIVTEVTEASLAAHKATESVPIVMVAVGDPVAAGLVASLARPGGNMTGVSQNIVETTSKRLEMLKLVVPDLAHVGVLLDPNDDNTPPNVQAIQATARRLGVGLVALEASSATALDKVLGDEIDARVRALYVTPSPLFVTRLRLIAEFAVRRSLPSIFHLPEFARFGGLLSYGPDRADIFRRSASYVDRILKGARPADLPIEQPTKSELVVNLATARTLGLTIPPLLMTQADEVIE